MSKAAWKPTSRLRWVRMRVPGIEATQLLLQQWFAPDVPSYMIVPTEGEWRDVSTEDEHGEATRP